MKNFRYARQRLLSEGKTKRYVSFALVETLLIMIGILLALKVDNWNERRNLSRTQNEAIFKLKDDLRNDIAMYNELDSTYSVWLEQTDYIFEEVLDGTTQSLTSQSQYHIGRGSMYYITLNNSTYTEMINTGILYELKNKDVLNSIIEYYNSSTFELEKLNTDNHDFFQWEVLRSSMETFSILFRLVEKRNLNHINWEWLSDPTSPLFKEFEVKISYFKTVINANLSVIGTLKNKAINTLETINDYQQ